MGLFDKFKQKQEEEVVQQDLTKEETYGGPFIMHLLMKEKCQMPSKERLLEVMENYMDRADLSMDFMEALIELFPQCEAIFFQSSGKLIPRDKIVGHQIPRQDRFIYFAVNVRFFNIQGTEDSIVDSIGMSTLFLPDVQYHLCFLDQGGSYGSYTSKDRTK